MNPESEPMEIVEASDGAFYVEPVIYKDGIDAYFRIESGEAVVFVRRFQNTSRRSSRTRVGKAVTDLGLSAKVREFRETTRVSFPPAFNGLVESDAWVINLLGPIPVPPRHEGRLTSPGTEVRFAWNVEFDQADVEAVLGEGDISPRLLAFALGLTIPPSERERQRRPLRRWLGARLPEGDLPERVLLRRER